MVFFWYAPRLESTGKINVHTIIKALLWPRETMLTSVFQKRSALVCGLPSQGVGSCPVHGPTCKNAFNFLFAVGALQHIIRLNDTVPGRFEPPRSR